MKKLKKKHFLLRMRGQFGTAPHLNKFLTRLKRFKENVKYL